MASLLGTPSRSSPACIWREDRGGAPQCERTKVAIDDTQFRLGQFARRKGEKCPQDSLNEMPKTPSLISPQSIRLRQKRGTECVCIAICGDDGCGQANNRTGSSTSVTKVHKGHEGRTPERASNHMEARRSMPARPPSQPDAHSHTTHAPPPPQTRRACCTVSTGVYADAIMGRGG